MSASKEWTEWHLTPRGWERGSTRVDFGGITEKEAPEDRVLTKKFHETMSSSFGGFERKIKDVWELEDEERVAALIKQFGECPESL